MTNDDEVRLASTRGLRGAILVAVLTILAIAPEAGSPGDPLAARRDLLTALERRLHDSESVWSDVAFCFAPDTPADLIDAFEMARSGPDQFRLRTRWSSTATDGGGLVQGDPTTITYSFVPDGTVIPGLFGSSASDLFTAFDALYPSTAAWQAPFHQVFARWGELTGVDYVFEPNDDGAQLFGAPGELGVRGDVRIGAMFIDGNSDLLAFNAFPDNGDMVLDSGDTLFFGNPSAGALGLRNTVAHEHGHGLGIEHVCPVNETKLMEPFLSTAFDGPQHDDILSAQRLYGDAGEHNDSVGSATTLGALSGSPIPVGDVSIDDHLDADVFAFSVSGPETVNVSVNPVGSVYLEGPQFLSCTSGTTFNSRAISNLAVRLLDTDGATILADSDAFGRGFPESLVNVRLPGAGTYYARVYTGGSVGSSQLYDLELSDADLDLRLAVNGLRPDTRVVETAGPVLLTLDMTPSVVTVPLGWFYGVAAGGNVVWFTPGGISAAPAPLLTAPPISLDDLTLLSTTLGPGSALTFIFALVGPGGVVASDFITAVVTG